MTYELVVLAGRPGFVSWGELRKRIIALFDEHDRLHWGVHPSLVYKGQAIEPSEVLQEDKEYDFVFQSPTTLSIMPTIFTALGGQNPLRYARDVLIEYAVNIDDPAILDTRVVQWVKGGHKYLLNSTRGRTQGEIALMIKIAVALAELRDGFIFVRDSRFVLTTQGIFTAEEFSTVESLQDDA